MNGYEINEVVIDHLYIGQESLLSYKKIIQKSAYPPFGLSVSLEIAQDAIDAYTKSGGSLFNIIELSVFFIECGTYFSDDFGGDMGEDFYEVLENTFEATLKVLKSENNTTLFDAYKPRLKAIIKVAHESGWGYGGQLDDYWEDILGA